MCIKTHISKSFNTLDVLSWLTKAYEQYNGYATQSETHMIMLLIETKNYEGLQSFITSINKTLPHDFECQYDGSTDTVGHINKVTVLLAQKNAPPLKSENPLTNLSLKDPQKYSVLIADDDLYIHASSKSAFINDIIDKQVSFSITHMDALVLSPTAFDHSFNYRSVSGFAKAEEIQGVELKRKFFNLFTDRYIPGRIADIGEPTDDQIAITKILKLSLDNAAAKVRVGDVNVKMSEDAPWCGIIPVHTSYGTPEKDSQLSEDLQAPDYIDDLLKTRS